MKNGVKNIQAAAYNGERTVPLFGSKYADIQIPVFECKYIEEPSVMPTLWIQVFFCSFPSQQSSSYLSLHPTTPLGANFCQTDKKENITIALLLVNLLVFLQKLLKTSKTEVLI